MVAPGSLSSRMALISAISRLRLISLPVPSTMAARSAIRVEYHTQIGPRLHHRSGQRSHGFLVFRVGHMIGKVPVRLQKLAALNPRTQPFQHLRVEAARAVTRVHHHVQAPAAAWQPPGLPRQSPAGLNTRRTVAKTAPAPLCRQRHGRHGRYRPPMPARRQSSPASSLKSSPPLLVKNFMPFSFHGWCAGSNHNGAVGRKSPPLKWPYTWTAWCTCRNPARLHPRRQCPPRRRQAA